MARLHAGHAWIIDVSQSVEHDHPRAYEFLRNDVRNIRAFFESRGCRVLSRRAMWDYVTSESASGGDARDTNEGGADSAGVATVLKMLEEEQEEDDEVFMASFIPRSMAEMDLRGDAHVTSVLSAGGGAGERVNASADTGVDAGADAAGGAEGDLLQDDDISENDSAAMPTRPRGFRHEDRDDKKVSRCIGVTVTLTNKERKKAVKEEKRERRKTKMSKGEKQRLMKR
jgi:RIO kinase 1